jgi:drug/metabolite transporter (DMT)-like permease
MAAPAPGPGRAYLALLLIALLWGSYPASAKLALRDFPPVFLVTVRCLIASAFLTALLARSSAGAFRELTPSALRAFLVLALTGVVGSMQLTYFSLSYTTAGNVVVLQVATPVLVALGARLYLGERLRALQWLGVGVSAFGVAVVITEGRLAALRPEELRLGDFINLVGMAGWSAYTVYGKRVLATHSPALATTAAYVLGTIVLVPLAIATAPLFPAPRLASPVAWFVVLYQALVGAVAHVWWYRAVEVVGPSRSAVFMNLQPLMGLALAALLVGEGIGPWHLLGCLFVLAGVALNGDLGGSGRPPGPPCRALPLGAPRRSRGAPRQPGGRPAT